MDQAPHGQSDDPDQHLAPDASVPAADAVVALSVLGQDLRSVLVGTAGAAELASATIDDTRVRGQIDELLSGLSGAIALVDDLLSFAGAVRDKQASSFTPAELLGECLAQASSQVQRSAVSVRSLLKTGSDLPVCGDSAACELLITTLLRSAIIHATGHEVVAGVEAEPVGDRVQLRFRIGIDGMDAPLAADRLLALCRGIAARLSGQLISLGSGGFQLQLELDGAEAITRDCAAHPELLTGRSALVVDDDPALRRVYATLLGDLGASCQEAADGLQALERCGARRFDLVLMDLNMPRMDGFAAIRALHETQDAPPPIIAITALSDSDASARSVAEGAVVCLRKPLQRAQVVAAIRRCLGDDADDDVAVTGGTSFQDDQLRQTLDLMGGGEQAIEILRELVDSYHAATPSMVEELRQAQASTPIDLATLERVAHTLKSRSAALGLGAAREAAAELEDRARAADLVPDQVAALIERFERARATGAERLELFLDVEVET